MKSEGWIITAVIAAVWVTGCITTLVFALFLDPRMSPEDRRSWRSNLPVMSVFCFFGWYFLLPDHWRRYWFHRDIRTGKRPAWIILDRSEHSGKSWTLSDGLEWGAGIYGGNSTRATRIQATCVEEEVAGTVEYRIQKVAPVQGKFSSWQSMSCDDTDYDDEAESYLGAKTNHEVKVKLPRGKYKAEFRFPNRSGVIEEQSGVTFVVAEFEEYADA